MHSFDDVPLFSQFIVEDLHYLLPRKKDGKPRRTVTAPSTTSLPEIPEERKGGDAAPAKVEEEEQEESGEEEGVKEHELDDEIFNVETSEDEAM